MLRGVLLRRTTFAVAALLASVMCWIVALRDMIAAGAVVLR
jgi:hypothetical protein